MKNPRTHVTTKTSSDILQYYVVHSIFTQRRLCCNMLYDRSEKKGENITRYKNAKLVW